MIDNAVAQLVRYAEQTGLIAPEDHVWAVNSLLEALRLDSYAEPALPDTPIDLPAVLDALLDDAVARGAAVADGGEVSHPKAGAGARKLEEQAAEQLRETLAAAAGAPPSTGELIASSGLDSSLVHRALGSLEKQGLVRRIGADFYFDVSALAAFEQAVRARLADGPATAAELKDAMGTSRKYAIPLLEYFDSQAVTRREGDTRVPGGR